MDLVIKDCPDDKLVQEEIIGNAMTTIANFKRRQIPVSAEALAVEEEIVAIRDKNIEVKPVVEPVL